MRATSYEEAVALFATPADAALKVSAMQAASPIVLALDECDPELRAEAINLFKQLHSGKLERDEIYSTAALLSEILFPNADSKGLPGLDLEEAEELAKEISPEAKEDLARMDQEEETFATRLRSLMDEKGLTQEELATRIGVGQPAISMMLGRNCRPQKRTVVRLAEAIGVSPEELWLSMKGRE